MRRKDPVLAFPDVNGGGDESYSLNLGEGF